ncbi:3'-5' exonuclease [Aeromonas lacus]|uniref:3'-5' exonuclease n=1 Tax=Aeromonas lacus TaxID=558884 RepID=UPI00137780A5
MIFDGGWQRCVESNTNNIEEERRLFYVAMTRAIQRLVVMSRADQRHPPLSLPNVVTTRRSRLQPLYNNAVLPSWACANWMVMLAVATTITWHTRTCGNYTLETLYVSVSTSLRNGMFCMVKHP